MSLEGQDLESLRRMIKHLQEENQELKELLRKNNITFNEPKEEVITESTDEGAYIKDTYIYDKLVAYFLTLFQGRRDVYALRGSKGGYFPQCLNRWKDYCPKQNTQRGMSCQKCPYREWKALDREVGQNHLLGHKDNCTDVIGLYPLLEDDTCKLLVFDFDNHDKDNSENNDWKDEIDAIRKICHENGIDVLIERSRSGNGAHAWILFKDFIPASLAREFGLLLIEKGAQSINIKSFKYYDRMFPTQDHSEGLGNLVALPLQRQALRQGNSVFVDENWNPYFDQWKVLKTVHLLTKNEIEEHIYKWKEELSIPQTLLTVDQGKRIKPWKKDENFHNEDVIEKLSIVLADGIYVDTLNLKPRIQNQIRRLAAFDNPTFYKNHNLGYSNWNQPRVIYLGEEVNDYIKIPRGLLETLLNKCHSSNIEYEIIDKREKGKPITVSFTGKLRDEQLTAASHLLDYDNGVLNAATAFGKTVVSSYLISKRKVNTLIIMQSVSLIDQWVDELHHFLEINEDLPIYKTKTGIEKQRQDLIGVLHGGKNTLTGIIDVVSVNSIYDKDGNCRLDHEYGMVIVDECHHGASQIFENVLRQINSKYVYGVSANEKRIDGLEKKVYMQLGPIRHQYTSKERIEKQSIDHYVFPRFTRIMPLVGESKNDLNSAYAFISKNENRNNMIISDIKKCIEEKRTPIVLTRYKDHAKSLYESLKENVLDHTYLIFGDHSLKENEEVRKTILSLPHDEPFVLVATSQSVGEGFNVPRLDTLFLTSPVSGEPLVDQFLGRINRDYKYKQSAIVYDYVDSHIHYFNNMYKKRLSAYRKIGFDVITDLVDNKQNVNHIYNYSDYLEVFRQDIHEANKSIIISSPQLNEKKVLSFIDLIKDRQEKGVSVNVFTKQTDEPYTNNLIDLLYGNGIFVEVYPDLDSYFAVIDQEIVWHGGINLLGKSNIYDSLMRVKSTTIAEELIFSPTETKDCDS